MKTTVLIPMKLKNERVPGKNTMPFSDGTPLCHLLQRTVLTVAEVDEVVVFCSDESINDYIIPGVKFLKRPETLDTDETLCADVIRAFINMFESDLYVLSHVTSPFVRAERFSACINAVKSGVFDSAFTCRKLQTFLWYDGKPLNFALDKIPRTQNMQPAFCETSAVYTFTREVFEKYGGRTGARPFMCECSELECIDIDYPEDFTLADTVWMHILKNGMEKAK